MLRLLKLKVWVICLLTLKKTKQYYQHKISIDKRVNKDAAYKIQFYNNGLIDDYVATYDDHPHKPSHAELWAGIQVIMKPYVYKNYQRIINSPYTSNANFDKLLVRHAANNDLNEISEKLVERVSKNLDYVEQVMRSYEVTTAEYQKFVDAQRNRSLASRQQILKDLAYQSNQLLVNEGLNIPSAYSYRNPDILAESLNRQSQMKSNRELHLAENEQSQSEGNGEKYTGHRWIWTGIGMTTRHASNHLQERKIDEPFVILNDVTMDIDELMYPCDPAGDPSNTYICYCEEEFF